MSRQITTNIVSDNEHSDYEHSNNEHSNNEHSDYDDDASYNSLNTIISLSPKSEAKYLMKKCYDEIIGFQIQEVSKLISENYEKEVQNIKNNKLLLTKNFELEIKINELQQKNENLNFSIKIHKRILYTFLIGSGICFALNYNKHLKSK